MDEMMTLAEIEARYPSEWILIADPEVDRHLDIIRGRVVCHSKDRDEVDRKAIELRLKSSVFHYTGEIPKDMEFALSVPLNPHPLSLSTGWRRWGRLGPVSSSSATRFRRARRWTDYSVSTSFATRGSPSTSGGVRSACVEVRGPGSGDEASRSNPRRHPTSL
jgi:hypothetical protein